MRDLPPKIGQISKKTVRSYNQYAQQQQQQQQYKKDNRIDKVLKKIDKLIEPGFIHFKSVFKKFPKILESCPKIS